MNVIIALFRIVQLSEASVTKLAGGVSINNITSLNLHGNGLQKIRPLQNLHSLKKLIISFNELSKLEDISHMVSSLTMFESTCNE